MMDISSQEEQEKDSPPFTFPPCIWPGEPSVFQSSWTRNSDIQGQKIMAISSQEERESIPLHLLFFSSIWTLKDLNVSTDKDIHFLLNLLLKF